MVTTVWMLVGRYSSKTSFYIVEKNMNIVLFNNPPAFREFIVQDYCFKSPAWLLLFLRNVKND